MQPTLGSVFTACSIGNCENNDLVFFFFPGTEPLKFRYLPFVLSLVQLAAQFVFHVASDAFFLFPRPSLKNSPVWLQHNVHKVLLF